MEIGPVVVVISPVASSLQSTHLKRGRDESEVATSSLAVPSPVGMSCTLSFELVGSDKQVRVDLWSSHRASPIASESGVSGVLSFSLYLRGRPPSEEPA